jgi:hypothetical protein
MSVVVTCPDCRRQFRGPDKVSGRKINCPACGTLFRVSTGQQTPSYSGAAENPTGRTNVTPEHAHDALLADLLNDELSSQAKPLPNEVRLPIGTAQSSAGSPPPPAIVPRFLKLASTKYLLPTLLLLTAYLMLLLTPRMARMTVIGLAIENIVLAMYGICVIGRRGAWERFDIVIGRVLIAISTIVVVPLSLYAFIAAVSAGHPFRVTGLILAALAIFVGMALLCWWLYEVFGFFRAHSVMQMIGIALLPAMLASPLSFGVLYRAADSINFSRDVTEDFDLPHLRERKTRTNQPVRVPQRQREGLGDYANRRPTVPRDDRISPSIASPFSAASEAAPRPRRDPFESPPVGGAERATANPLTSPAPRALRSELSTMRPYDPADEIASRMLLRQAYLNLAAEADEETLASSLHWYAPGNEALMGLRWGIGVIIAGAVVQPQVTSQQQLQALTGPIGLGIAEGLADRLNRGDFGGWPTANDSMLEYLVLLGGESESELAARARGLHLDAVVVFRLERERIGLTGRYETNLQARIVDTRNRQSAWLSDWPSHRDVAQDSSGQTVDRFVQEVLTQIDRRYRLVPLEELSDEQLRGRKASLTRSNVRNTLAAVAELRYFQTRDVLEVLQAAAAYSHLLEMSMEDGRRLAEGGASQRRQVLQRWLAQNPTR